MPTATVQPKISNDQLDAAILAVIDEHDDFIDNHRLVWSVEDKFGIPNSPWNEPFAAKVKRAANVLADRGQLVKYDRDELFPSTNGQLSQKYGGSPAWGNKRLDEIGRQAVADAAARLKAVRERFAQVTEHAKRRGVTAEPYKRFHAEDPTKVVISVEDLERLLSERND